LASFGMTSRMAIATGAVKNTGAVGGILSVSGSIIAFMTPEGWIGVDLNGDGDMIDHMIRYYDVSTGALVNTGADGGILSVSGSIIAFITIEGWIGVDLNGDGDMGDQVIRYYDISTGALVNTGADGDSPSVSGSIIAFYTYEWSIGVDLNGDGDMGDNVIRYYDISTGTLTNTGADGDRPFVSGSIITFVTGEWYIGVDLNGDGDMGDYVIRYYDVSTGALASTGAVGGGIAPWLSVSGNIIAFVTYEGWIDVDLNGDGDMGDNVIRYYDISTGTLTNTGADGVEPSVSGSIIAFNTPEVWIGVDLNGDGDIGDQVIRYYDVSTGALTNTGADGVMPSVSGSIIAFMTPEVWIGVDLNGDGDMDDLVIRYFSMEEAPTIETIKDQVDAFLADGSIDNEGIAEALYAFLKQAQAMIDRGNAKATTNTLNALISLVEAQSGKHITIDAAQTLIVSAQAVINSL